MQRSGRWGSLRRALSIGCALAAAGVWAVGCASEPRANAATPAPGPPAPSEEAADAAVTDAASSPSGIDPSCATDPSGIDGTACATPGAQCGVPGYVVVCASGAWTRTPPCCKK